mmetsp:Transcript_48259/g.140688  ORF Transcript_48259/g.140688 Transcript_48259/m.140688 type:complete len:271 (+) Transcript_48259:314-1126(+)
MAGTTTGGSPAFQASWQGRCDKLQPHLLGLRDGRRTHQGGFHDPNDTLGVLPNVGCGRQRPVRRQWRGGHYRRDFRAARVLCSRPLADGGRVQTSAARYGLGARGLRRPADRSWHEGRVCDAHRAARRRHEMEAWQTHQHYQGVLCAAEGHRRQGPRRCHFPGAFASVGGATGCDAVDGRCREARTLVPRHRHRKRAPSRLARRVDGRRRPPVDGGSGLVCFAGTRIASEAAGCGRVGGIPAMVRARLDADMDAGSFGSLVGVAAAPWLA